MFIVLALSSSNILDKSQGAAAEIILLQSARKSVQLQAENGRTGAGEQSLHRNVRMSDAKEPQRSTIQRYLG